MTVYMRNRGMSKLAFYQQACKIRTSLTKLVMSDKKCPKKYRFYFAYPLYTTLSQLFTNMRRANEIRLDDTNEQVELRRQLQEDAIKNVAELAVLLDYMVDVLPIKLEKIEPIYKDLGTLEITLKRWKDSSQLRPKSQFPKRTTFSFSNFK